MIPPTSRPEPAPAARALPPDEARAPRPLADRLRLLCILVLLPGLAVMVPTLVVTGIFGQRPKTKAPPDPKALRLALENSAAGLLPPPPALAPEPLVVTVRPDHLTARLNKISRQAAQFGGSAAEGLSTDTEKRLSVDLPAGSADAFRRAVASNTAAAAAPSPSAARAGRDYVEVIIRAAGDDE